MASKKPASNTPGIALQQGLVVASFGRHCVVESADGRSRICHPRGKKSQAVVGDRVLWSVSADEGVVESIEPRRNLLYRQDEIRTKSFAANLDLVLVLLAAQPEFSESQLTRALIAAQAQDIPCLIVLNKSDLGERFDLAWGRLTPYRDMGLDVLGLCLHPKDEHPPQANATKALKTHHDVDVLASRLMGKTTLVLGPSGVGKSTLVNHLVPQARAHTNDISLALNSGKHTTTSTRWYWLDETRTSALIDSPGFQEFGLHHIDAHHLAAAMPDLRAALGQCRFYNCTHMHEPSCGVRQAVQGRGTGPTTISAQRYRLYQSLFEELSQPRHG